MSKIVSSGSDPDPKVKFLSIALAIVLALFWGFLILGIWWFFGNKENVYAGSLVNWLARFHLLLLHIPVGMVFIVIALELFGKVPGFHHIKEATTFSLWLTLLGAIGASILGYLLMEVEEVSGRAMTLHMWTGLGVVGLSLFALIFKLKGQGMMYGVTLLLTAVCVSAVGHFGGAMVHGKDYLAEYAPAPLQPVLRAGLGSGENGEAHGDDNSEMVIANKNVYADYVAPILEKTCYSCHDENKIKGKLRMDTHELLLAGAESEYPTVIPGDPEESEMIVRVLLPSDDDEFMPPKGDGLTEEEIDLLKLWIKAGAKLETTVADLGDDPSILPMLAAIDTRLIGQEALPIGAAPKWESMWDKLSPEEQSDRLAKVQMEAEKLNVSVLPVSAEDLRLRVNVLNGAGEFGDEQIEIFEPVAEHIAWINLANSKITDESLKTVSKMKGLEKLHLENTQITDAGVAYLTPLQRLEYLNLYSTKISNSVFDSFKQMPALRKIYVWQTEVDPYEARRFEKSVNLEINTGVDLDKAATEASEEAANEAEMKKAETPAKPAA